MQIKPCASMRWQRGIVRTRSSTSPLKLILKGKPLDEAFQQVQDSDQEVNKINEQAIVLLKDGQVFEARNLLRSELLRHPRVSVSAQ